MTEHHTHLSSWRSDLFAGQVVVVTGGTSGIGAGVARRFAELGATVHAVGLAADGPHAPRHPAITTSQLDVRDGDAVHEFAARMTDVHVLVCCAGISRDRDEYEIDVFSAVLEVNLTATMRCAEAFRPMLRETGGSIATTASMYTYFGAADRPAYSASKGGVAQLARSLAAEYATDGIRVNAIAPGWIETPLSEVVRTDPSVNANIVGRTPLGRWGSPADVAEAYVFLASPAARYITGVILPVDGGYLTV